MQQLLFAAVAYLTSCTDSLCRMLLMSASASAAEKKFFTRKSLQRGNLVRCEGAGWGGGRAAKEVRQQGAGGKQKERLEGRAELRQICSVILSQLPAPEAVI